MKVIVTTLSDKGLETRDYRQRLHIKIKNKAGEEKEFSVAEGEPEDMSLGRDLNDCYSIPELLLFAFEAGIKAGKESNGQEDFVIENVEKDDCDW